jgi:3-phosphoshikimate 1-carboxyvinyltransferase
MTTYRISKKDKTLKGTIHLTTSKSESNRVLIIQALCDAQFLIHNLAKAKDTETLNALLTAAKGQEKALLDVGPAGTTMRFLAAFLAISEGLFELTGSKRMQERPIGILVDALKSLGADISYTKNEGFPPLRIHGKKVVGGDLSINGSVSSQYITALLLIAPCLPKGLKLRLEGEIASRPYIEMTLKIMQYFGVKSTWEGATITILPQVYVAKDYTIEADWSAASYWFEMAAMAEETDLTLMGLHQTSLQGDAAIAEMMTSFGVETRFIEGGLVLTKKCGTLAKPDFSYDFSDCPDIAQTIAVTAAALHVDATLSGLASLKIKETDRIAALSAELTKIGKLAKEEVSNNLKVHTSGSHISQPKAIATYEDHRMAMAFAPLALVLNHIDIEEPQVVEKSYPGFWDDLRAMGFEIEYVN